MIAQIIQNIGWIVFIGGLTTLLFTITYAVKRRKSAPSTTATPPPVPGTVGRVPVQSNGSGCLILIIIGVIAVVLISLVSANPKYVNVATAKFRQIINMETTEEWEWYWETSHGEYVNGRNRVADNERSVELAFSDSNKIGFNQNYMEYGNPEVMKIRLYKTSEKVWKGSADQSNPEQHRRLELIETSPGVYAGEITWENNIKGTCYVKRK